MAEERTIRIPRTNPSRGMRTYALLILRPPVARVRLGRFTGTGFRPGTQVAESELHPEPHYPATPLLIEYAGQDKAGGLHYRDVGGGGKCYRDLHILWRFHTRRGAFEEIGRISSHGPEWVEHLAHIVRRELALTAAPVNYVEVAQGVSERVLKVLDGELDALEDEGRDRAMSFLWDQFNARLLLDPWASAYF